MRRYYFKGLAMGVGISLLVCWFIAPQIQAADKIGEKKININKASVAELQKLPRIGEKIAQRIVDFRNEHGKFKKIEEIMKVKGIGEKVFEKIKDLITVDEKAGKN